MIQITPQRIAAVYGVLRAFEPFEKWNLPFPEDIRFRVSSDKHGCGYTYEKDSHIWLEISRNGVTTFQFLVMVVGHEAIHVKQKVDRIETPNTMHNADFRKRWKHVCRLYHWEAGLFV